MHAIALDFETYYKKSEYSIADLGNWRYCNDERFDPYLLTVYDGEQTWAGNPRDFNWSALDGALLLAHNAAFDSAVTRRLSELGSIPKVENQWHCTANLASCLFSVRSLKDACKVAWGEDISKGARDDANGKHWADIVAEGKDRSMIEYAVGDARRCHRLWTEFSPRWSEFEQSLSRLTIKQGARGVAIDTELLTQYRRLLQEAIFNLEKSMPWIERGSAPTSPRAIAEECRLAGIPAPPAKTKDEEGFLAWEVKWGPQYPWVCAAGHWRQLSKLLASLDTIQERLRPDNTIDFSLLYFGATTGRWSGGGSGFNMQNMRKVPIFIKEGRLIEPPAEAAGKAFKEWVAASVDHVIDIRRLFVARPGKKFILADLSQIEPRVLAWLTGNTKLLEMLKSGMSIYEAFARVSMGWTGGNLKKEDPDKYQLAKIQVLGLGYGCGWEKFITIAAGYGVPLTNERSMELVAGFRANNQDIVGLWNQLDESFRQSDGGDFEVGLPSGRSLVYRNVLREVKPKFSKKLGKWEKRLVHTAEIGLKRYELYGGLLTENLVQATARDVFSEHVLALEEQIGDVIFTVHDEAITEVDPDITTKDVEHVMSQCPDWIEGLPVCAEAQESPHYKK